MTPHERVQLVPRGVESLTRPTHRRNQPVTLLSQAAICKRLGISDETWRRWTKAGLAPSSLPGFPFRRPRWSLLDIEAFERGRPVGPMARRYFGGTLTARLRRAK